MDRAEYPPAFEDEGGVSIPHVPTEKESRFCAFSSRAGADCPAAKKIKSGGSEAPTKPTGCAACAYHPYRHLKKAFVKAGRGGLKSG